MMIFKILQSQRILRDKIPADYEHNQIGLHEITTCDARR